MLQTYSFRSQQEHVFNQIFTTNLIVYSDYIGKHNIVFQSSADDMKEFNVTGEVMICENR